MPKVNSVSAPAPKPNQYPAPAKSTPVAPQSTIAPRPQQQQSSGLQVPIPEFLQQTSMPETMAGMESGYIGFGDERSANWGSLSAAGVIEGMTYISKYSTITPLPTLKFWLLRGDSFQTLMVGQKGLFKFATRDLEIEGPRDGANYTAEHYIGLLIVETPSGVLVPVKGDFRGTKAPGLKAPINAVKAASTPEWCNQSDAHKVASGFPQPWGRVLSTVTTRREVSKSNGNPYFRAMATCRPTGATEIQKLVQAFNDEIFNKSLKEANDNYNFRVQFLDDIASGKVKQ